MAHADSQPAPQPTHGDRWPAVAVLVVCTLVLILFRLHAFDVPLETDEANYAYIASRLLAGDELYLDVWDHQPPGIYVLFAGLQAVFGDAPSVYRWAAAVFSVVSLWLVYAIARRCAGCGAATVCAVLFALASSDPGTAGEGCNREIFMTTFVLAAWWTVLRRDNPGWRHVFIAGCLLAIASWIKTIIAIHWLALGVLVVLMPSRDRRSSLPKLIAAYCTGPALLWAATFVYFAASQRFAEFVEAVFTFNLSYSAGDDPFLLRFGRFFAPKRHPFVFISALPLWIAGAAASAWVIYDAICHRNRTTFALLMLILASYLAAALPGQFWAHYYYLLIAPLVITVGWASHRLAQNVATRRHAAWLPSVAIAVWLVVTEYHHYLSQPSLGITLNRYSSRDFWARAIGEKLAQVSDPDDRVFVYGREAGIYYYARRQCASRYTMTTAIDTAYAGAAERRETLMADLQRSMPRVIIVLFDQPPFPAWMQFLEQNYGPPVGWDCDDRYTDTCDQPTREKLIMLVFADQNRPIAPMDWNWDRSEVGGGHVDKRR